MKTYILKLNDDLGSVYIYYLTHYNFKKKNTAKEMYVVDNGHDRMIKNNAFHKFINESVHLI